MKSNIIEIIRNRIIDEFDNLDKLAKIDKKYNVNDFNKAKIISVFQNFYTKDTIDFLNKSIGIIYFGDYEFTLYFILYSIMNNIKLYLFTQDYHCSINYGIINIVNDVLEDNRYSKIELYNMVSWKKIEDISNDIDEIICFGDSNSFNILKSKNVHNIKNFNYKLLIYCESDKYKDLEKKIISIAYNTCIEIRCIKNLSEIDDLDYWRLIVLSSNKNLINSLKIKYNNIIINDNPFKYMEKNYEMIEQIFNLKK